MNVLSLFSGIESVSVAWQPLGFKPVAFAEIEPFACALLKQHYPDVPNLGDVMGITEAQIAALGPIDVVVGGSPCQDMSLAGRRKGVLGERSGLFFEQMRLFHAARKHCGARFLIWENVPGCFSSGQGRDFTGVVAMLAGCRLPVPEGGWQSEGVALGEQGLVEWAVLDAQWFGLAQRRNRVFAVLDTGNWHARPPILLEPESLRGNIEPRRQAPKSPARHLAAGARSHRRHYGYDQRSFRFFRLQSFGEYIESETASTLKSRDYKDNTGNLILCPPDDSGRAPIRCLTPLECERLQGFPDHYTRIAFAGKSAAQCPDKPRYQVLGNSMAVPVMRWIGQRLQAAAVAALE